MAPQPREGDLAAPTSRQGCKPLPARGGVMQWGMSVNCVWQGSAAEGHRRHGPSAAGSEGCSSQESGAAWSQQHLPWASPSTALGSPSGSAASPYSQAAGGRALSPGCRDGAPATAPPFPPLSPLQAGQQAGTQPSGMLHPSARTKLSEGMLILPLRDRHWGSKTWPLTAAGTTRKP